MALFVKNNFEKKHFFVFYRTTPAEPQPDEEPEEFDTFQVFVKDLTGKTITLDVEGSDTIEKVKAKIRNKLWGLERPVSFYMNWYLKWHWRVLEDGRRLSDYYIGKGSIMRMVARLPGFVLNYFDFVVYFYKK